MTGEEFYKIYREVCTEHKIRTEPWTDETPVSDERQYLRWELDQPMRDILNETARRVTAFITEEVI